MQLRYDAAVASNKGAQNGVHKVPSKTESNSFEIHDGLPMIAANILEMNGKD
jgi:hypothetical protein